MEQVIYSQFGVRPHAKGQKAKASKDKKVSLAGYIPHEELIKSMLRAGKRLYDARTAIYDVPEGKEVDIDDIPLDPTRSKDFGFAEATEALKNAKEHVERVKKAQQKVVKQEKKDEKSTEKVDNGHTNPLDSSMAK